MRPKREYKCQTYRANYALSCWFQISIRIHEDRFKGRNPIGQLCLFDFTLIPCCNSVLNSRCQRFVALFIRPRSVCDV